MELPQRPDLTDIIKEEKSPDRMVALSVLWYFCGFFAVVSLFLYRANSGLNNKGSDTCEATVKYLRTQNTALSLKVDLKQAEIDGIKESNRIKDSATLSSLNNRLEHDKRVDKITTPKK